MYLLLLLLFTQWNPMLLALQLSQTPKDILPEECYSPKGDKCNWYPECLELRYPCQYSSDDYAIEYAERFCKLFLKNYNNFSSSGRMWIDGVWKCLQVKLVPFMRPWMNETCADIKQEAFKSHPSCYISPAPEVSGVCSLPWTDVWMIFWLVNFKGGALFSAPVETGLQTLYVTLGCIDEWKRQVNSET